MSKLVVAGDWHGDIRWLERVLRSLARTGHTTIYHLGDLAVLWPAANDNDKFTRLLIKWLTLYDMHLVFIDGNHDVHPRLRKLPLNAEGFGVLHERVLYAPRGHRWAVDGIRFGALGGAYSVDRGDRKPGKTWWEGEEVTADDVTRLGHGPLDVLLTHEVPAGVPVVPERGFDPLPAAVAARANEGRALVAEVVANTSPALVFSGHWHQRLTAAMAGSAQVHVLDRNNREGNLVVLDTETLCVEDYPLSWERKR